MYTPHTVTIYNFSEDPLTLEAEYNVTVLEGVFLDISKGENIRKSGLESADAATLFIPFTVKAVDGFTEREKAYIEPKEYARLEDKSGCWTLETGGTSSGADCYFVKGRVVKRESYAKLRQQNDYVYDVTTVDLRDFGSARMQHWQVGGQ